ncbi:MAG: cell division protein FtsL [Rhodocyclaceae bacterium]|nr:cell division protein FtsL [Rhodocyclaceae bacterium]MCP5255730.1 cell division protein FtsL [Zoogloeaceae bacterium]MCW5615642.1 cell division protein FtsL [Rhodocyclaceae bacterium]
MGRMNAILVLLVVLSALGLVAAQHQARKFYSEYEREQTGMHELEVEWGQLQLEQSTWASHARVEKIARERLGMRPPADGTLVVVEVTK